MCHCFNTSLLGFLPKGVAGPGGDYAAREAESRLLTLADNTHSAVVEDPSSCPGQTICGPQGLPNSAVPIIIRPPPSPSGDLPFPTHHVYPRLLPGVPHRHGGTSHPIQYSLPIPHPILAGLSLLLALFRQPPPTLAKLDSAWLGCRSCSRRSLLLLRWRRCDWSETLGRRGRRMRGRPLSCLSGCKAVGGEDVCGIT